MILLIDNYDSFTYNLYQCIAQCAAGVTVVRNDQVSLDDINALELDGLILSPGPGRPEHAGICLEVITATAGRHPILGVCLGHQAIAMAYGGRVIPAPHIMHGKKSTIQHTGTGLYRGLPEVFSVGRYHSLTVEPESLPDCLMVESSTEEGVIMGIKHRDLPTYGVQFHPESVLTEQGIQCIKNFVDLCDETLLT